MEDPLNPASLLAAIGIITNEERVHRQMIARQRGLFRQSSIQISFSDKDDTKIVSYAEEIVKKIQANNLRFNDDYIASLAAILRQTNPTILKAKRGTEFYDAGREALLQEFAKQLRILVNPKNSFNDRSDAIFRMFVYSRNAKLQQAVDRFFNIRDALEGQPKQNIMNAVNALNRRVDADEDAQRTRVAQVLHMSMTSDATSLVTPSSKFDPRERDLTKTGGESTSGANGSTFLDRIKKSLWSGKTDETYLRDHEGGLAAFPDPKKTMLEDLQKVLKEENAEQFQRKFTMFHDTYTSVDNILNIGERTNDIIGNTNTTADTLRKIANELANWLAQDLQPGDVFDVLPQTLP